MPLPHERVLEELLGLRERIRAAIPSSDIGALQEQWLSKVAQIEQYAPGINIDKALDGIAESKALSAQRGPIMPPASPAASPSEGWLKRILSTAKENKGKTALITAGVVGAAAIGYAALHTNKQAEPSTPLER